MRAIVYSSQNIEDYFFSPSCFVIRSSGELILASMFHSDRMVLTGDDYVLNTLQENLMCGVEEAVLQKLLSFLPGQDLFMRLKEGHYIE